MADAHLFPNPAEAVPDRAAIPIRDGWTSLTLAFLRAARKYKNKTSGIDGQGTMTFGQLEEHAVAASCVIRRMVGEASYVGVMVPPSNGAVLANVAVTLISKAAVNLSYALTCEDVNAQIHKAGITHVIVSRAAMDKFPNKMDNLDAELIYLEDIARHVTPSDKLFTGLVTRLMPIAAARLLLAGARQGHDDPATLLFTSGSTGEPKGVMLSQGNILWMISSVTAHTDVIEDEVILGALPFFHSFGYTLALWTALTLGKTVVYWPNPLDFKKIRALIKEHGVTLMATTPTLMRMYILKAKPEDFASVRMLLLGSEKLKPELAADIRKLGLIPVEAYGATECSPGISSNVPRQVRTPDGRLVDGNKIGSVGQPMPGITVRIVDLNSGRILPHGSEGLIFVHGDNVMKGYIGEPGLTADVLRNGWYCTGDIGYIDADGFVWITDRLSRFAKVAGEMVPLIKVEKALLAITGSDELSLSCTAIPDASKGERVVVVYTPKMGMTPAAVVAALAESELPLLWRPRANDFTEVAQLPTGQTGKLDLKAVKKLAIENLS